MSKDTRFSIHDWQAKQRLKEQERPFFANQKYYDLLNDLRDEGHLHRYGVTQLQMQFGLSEEEAQKIYNQYKEDLKAEQPDAYDFYMKDLNEALNPEVSQKVNAFIKAMAKRYDYSEQDAVFAIMAALKQRDFDGMNEHHAGDYNPGFLKQSVNTFLDKLKKKTKEGKDYKTVEKIMEKYFSAKKKNENVTEALNPEVSQKVNAFIKAMAKRYDYSEQDAVFAIMAALKQRKTDEASTTGTGASFTPGTGAAYATPRAFGDNKRKKKKGYMGYKEI